MMLHKRKDLVLEESTNELGVVSVKSVGGCFKGFEHGWVCNPTKNKALQYVVGETMGMGDENVELCVRGLHCYLSAFNIFEAYRPHGTGFDTYPSQYAVVQPSGVMETNREKLVAERMEVQYEIDMRDIAELRAREAVQFWQSCLPAEAFTERWPESNLEQYGIARTRYGVAQAGICGHAMCGYLACAIADDYGVAEATDMGVAVAKAEGIAISNETSVAVQFVNGAAHTAGGVAVSYGGLAQAEEEGVAVCHGGHHALAYAKEGSVAVNNVWYRCATAEDRGVAVAPKRGIATVANEGVAVGEDVVVGENSVGIAKGLKPRARGGPGSTMVLVATDSDGSVIRQRAFTIDGEVFLPDRTYRFTSARENDEVHSIEEEWGDD